jgi:hypothetical protein
MQEQASVSHKHEEPKEILPKSEVNHLEAQPGTSAAATTAQAQPATTGHQAKKQKPSSPGTSKALTVIEVLAGTTFAFLVQLFRLRRKK